jgi:hypothetical protein
VGCRSRSWLGGSGSIATRCTVRCVPTGRGLSTCAGGVTWALPLYELALLTARYARPPHRRRHRDRDPRARPTRHLRTARQRPRARPPRSARRALPRRPPPRALRPRWASPPALRSCCAARRPGHRRAAHGRPRHSGDPGSWHGFVPTDERCHVEGMDGVYAADMTTYPIKQGGLATQQADTIAADIAARHAGLRAGDWPIVRVLRARLIGGAQPVDLFATLDGAGRPLDARLDAACGPAATLSAGRAHQGLWPTPDPVPQRPRAPALPQPRDSSKAERCNHMAAIGLPCSAPERRLHAPSSPTQGPRGREPRRPAPRAARRGPAGVLAAEQAARADAVSALAGAPDAATRSGASFGMKRASRPSRRFPALSRSTCHARTQSARSPAHAAVSGVPRETSCRT